MFVQRSQGPFKCLKFASDTQTQRTNTPPSMAPTTQTAATIPPSTDLRPSAPPVDPEPEDPAVAEGVITLAPPVPVVVMAVTAANVTTPFLTVEYELHELLGGIGCADGVAPFPC
jgi:hypothetical protein